jgi:AcrR family transcriptional regulator
MRGRPQRQRVDGARTTEAILRAAADLASEEGLDRLTIGTLAERLGMSKSGLFAHFGSKQELQLATVEAAARRVTAAVLVPALAAPRGLARLAAACDKLIDYLAEPEFPGGCFFNMTRAEFHARPGPVRDAIAERKSYWRQFLERLVHEAQAQGELAGETDPEQLAFELEAVMDAATWSVANENGASELDHARRAVRHLLDSWRAPRRRDRQSGRRRAAVGKFRRADERA